MTVSEAVARGAKGIEAANLYLRTGHAFAHVVLLLIYAGPQI
jgi:hypothetical protein